MTEPYPPHKSETVPDASLNPDTFAPGTGMVPDASWNVRCPSVVQNSKALYVAGLVRLRIGTHEMS